MATYNENLETINRALPAGEILAQMAEECSELAQAALKLRRALEGVNPTPVTTEEAISAITQELADVELCMDALLAGWLKQYISLKAIGEISNYKASRWAQRLTSITTTQREGDQDDT